MRRHILTLAITITIFLLTIASLFNKITAYPVPSTRKAPIYGCNLTKETNSAHFYIRLHKGYTLHDHKTSLNHPDFLHISQTIKMLPLTSQHADTEYGVEYMTYLLNQEEVRRIASNRMVNYIYCDTVTKLIDEGPRFEGKVPWEILVDNYRLENSLKTQSRAPGPGVIWITD